MYFKYNYCILLLHTQTNVYYLHIKFIIDLFFYILCFRAHSVKHYKIWSPIYISTMCCSRSVYFLRERERELCKNLLSCFNYHHISLTQFFSSENFDIFSKNSKSHHTLWSFWRKGIKNTCILKFKCCNKHLSYLSTLFNHTNLKNTSTNLFKNVSSRKNILLRDDL